MREIKFRGRSSKDKKTWFTGNLVYLTDIDEAYIDHYDGLRRVIERYPVDAATVGQYTGLRDSFGCEIYEGDVVLVSEDGEESKHEVRYMDDQDYPAFDLIPSSVRWSYESNGLSYCIVDYDANIEIRVIGNVHDNPGLLEVAHD